ncbi:MAG TPA: HD domain-containing protein [Planctomycetes bacterium]|nr:HD domain-containing protein [Planctomycetota bacterium]HIJ70859.1 HD domain-containing protein [Planctomycetota bacterium]
MAHLFINQIEPGVQINDVYMVTQPILRNTTRGDLYIAMYLSDMTGKVNGRMWRTTEAVYSRLPSEGFIRIRGVAELYQGTLQIVVNDFVVVEADTVSLSDYMPRTKKNISEMLSETKRILAEVRHQGLNALVDEFLGDADFMREFAAAPGGMQIHHNYLGGLLEHTHSMLKVARAILPLYPQIQADLVLTAVFLHDAGKTKELSYQMGFSYTDPGQLLGHMVLGIQMIDKKVDALAKKNIVIDPTVLDSLKHIILSHHGQYDFGSPKLPATAEAFFVYYIDNLDAKMNQVTELINNHPGNADWTAYQKTLETKLYRKRPLK